MVLTCLTNFITTDSDAMSAASRGLKRAGVQLPVGIICGFLIRALWTWFVWPLEGSISFLFVALPLSTLVAGIIHAVATYRAMKEHRRTFAGELKV